MLAMIALVGPADASAAAKAVKYEGETSSGHKITFTLKNGELWDMESGIAVSCVAIQGSGSPTGGVETFSYKGSVPLSAQPQEFTFMKKPAVYYNEVTTKHTLTSKIVNRKTGLIVGTQRIQYEFLIPTYPIPTFIIYSCLGEGASGRSRW